MGFQGNFVPFEPKLQMRFEMSLNNIPTYMVKASDMPNLDQNPVTVDYVNAEFKVKGKSRWQDITVTLYDALSPSSAGLIHDWVRDQHHNSNSGIDQYATTYKKQVDLVYFTPTGAVADQWTLYGAFIASANWGNVDLSSDDLLLLELTLSYDWAELSAGGAASAGSIGGDASGIQKSVPTVTRS